MIAARTAAIGQSGDEAAAEAVYREMIETTVFIMQSLESLICYGKRIFGLRSGIDIHDRGPALRPTAFGLDLARRHADRLGPLGPAR